MTNGLRLLFAKAFSHFAIFARKFIGHNVPGLGIALRRIRHDFEITIHGKKIFFNHKVSGAYGTLLTGDWNESETHIFLHKVIDKLDVKTQFIDVGGCIGEYAIDIADLDKIDNVTVFEPQPECARTIAKAAELNNFANIKIAQKIVSDKVGTERFILEGHSPSGSHIAGEEESMNSIEIECSTIDDEIKYNNESCILLIDVEGAELKVIRGGMNFINNCKPLIVFEYNDLTKKHFSLDELKKVLGDDYKIYRLRKDSMLDTDFSDTWNCVAIPASSNFEEICKTHLEDFTSSGKTRKQNKSSGN